MKEISVYELKNMMDNHDNFHLIDVREPYEYELANIGGENIPMGDIQTILNSVRQHQDKKVIIHCKGGKRSNRVIQYLLEIDRFNNIYNLGGGILAYKKEIDDSLQVT